MRRAVLIGLLFGACANTVAQIDIISDGIAPDSIWRYSIREEIIVEGKRRAGNSHCAASRFAATTDDALRSAQGVDMIRRANFASEPAIRGMSGGQLSVTIDGMKIVHACVDKMDPINSYVEVENLSRLEVTKGGADLSHAQTIGGSINMVTAKPDAEEPPRLQLETGYESASQLRFVRAFGSTSTGPFAFRGSASVKRAGEFRAGGDVKVSRSGYDKENYKFDVSFGLGAQHAIHVSYLGDNARDIGYPALIMDTRRTKMHFLSVEHVWKEVTPDIPSITTRLYTNRISHWMDDYDRTRDDILSRSIMPGMNMPMFGQTEVAGLLHEVQYTDARQTARLLADVYHLKAFADMNMVSLNPGILPMYVVNIGDATLTTAGVAGEYTRQITPATFLGVAGRCDYSARDLLNKTARDALAIYWQGAGSRITYLVASASVSAEVRPSTEISLRWTASRSQRLPTHIENYGYFLYNPLDNSIYVGNPRLAPERSWQSDLTFNWVAAEARVSCSLYYVGIENYIAGLTIIPGDPSNVLFPQAFRRFENIGRARIFGAELSGSVGLSDNLELRGVVRVQEGRSLSLHEPLPMMPPLTGFCTFRAFSDSMWSELTVRVANRQDRVSRSILPEDPTGGYTVVDVRAGIVLTRTVELRGGVENLFNRLYHEHSSINNLPSLGRNLSITVVVRL